jgi:NitT/TauT family transport system substrate-binding protein
MSKANRPMRAALAVAAALLSGWAAPSGAAAQEPKLTLGLPGIPPVFATVLQYTAREEGFFKKYGVAVTLREFDSGAAAARAVQSGNIDVSLSPTPVIVNMISNAGVDLVTIWGMENPTWVLATTDPGIAKCPQVKGQGVGVDSINGARSVALREMITPCGLKAGDVNEIPLSTNVGAAMIAGQLKIGVLHMDDVPVIEEQLKKKLHFITSMREVNPVNHYLVLVVQREAVAKKRDAYVRLLAAHIDATRFLKDPKNADRISQIAKPTGRSPSVAKAALAKYLDMEFWPFDRDGLTRRNLEAVVENQRRTGAIREGRTPVGYDKLADPTVWRDAMAMVRARGGK